jgi:hypothetical protein
VRSGRDLRAFLSALSAQLRLSVTRAHDLVWTERENNAFLLQLFSNTLFNIFLDPKCIPVIRYFIFVEICTDREFA